MHNLRGRWSKNMLNRQAYLGIATVVFFMVTFFWQLGSLPFSGQEKATLNSASTIHQVIHDPTNAPYKILVYALSHFHHASPLSLRTISVVYGLVIAACFYFIVRYWFGVFSAWLGVFLLGFTPLFMLLSRSATGLITFLFPIVLIATYMWLLRSKSFSLPKILLSTLLIVAAVYVPGGIVFLIIAIIYTRSTLAQLIRSTPKTYLGVAIVILLAGLVPLALAIARNPALAKPLFLVPTDLPRVLDIIKWCAWSLLALFWHSGLHNTYQLGRVAIFDAAEIILAIFGIYAIWTRAKYKARSLLAALILVILFTALNQNYNFLVATIPLLVIFCVGGLRYLYLEWTTVFPRNPLPRNLALVLILAVISLHVVWGIHYSLTAWPHSFALLR